MTGWSARRTARQADRSAAHDVFLEDRHHELVRGLALFFVLVDDRQELGAEVDFEGIVQLVARKKAQAGIQLLLEISLKAQGFARTGNDAIKKFPDLIFG